MNFIEIFIKILEIDSTSGKERALSEYLCSNFSSPSTQTVIEEVGDGSQNLFIKWGEPEIVFCTHLDTVPPYFAPRVDGNLVYGRGACDAKGQIIAMHQTCLELEKEGHSNFGLLLLSGEECGSKGAKIQKNTGKFAIVGEPNNNHLASAGKGTKLYEIEISGKKAHSGYPAFGENAILRFVKFVNELNSICRHSLPQDPELGQTTFNIGKLASDNSHNVISDSVQFLCYFRTTFMTDNLIDKMMLNLCNDYVKVKKISGDAPYKFFTVNGFNINTIAFGSDAPHLKGFDKVLLYGPGSIENAHTDKEQITISEIYQAINDLKKIYFELKKWI
ncbi:MAG: M20/M25/M40 family metallo-hydrolase [Bacteroidales bacterium]|jgi:acetylornithine deacetylase|nr:M20/M25/M40 family metallo-hydrolase [Bacteroidales bacterium]